MMSQTQRHHHAGLRRGAATLVVLVVITAIALAVALGLSSGSLGGLAVASGESLSAASLAGADACVDEVMLKLFWDPSYAGGSLGIGRATCQMGVEASGSSRTVHVTSTQATYVRKIQVDLTLGGSGITVTGWREKTE